jgi:hypothetical protein
MHLALENMDHSETIFTQYVGIFGQRICPLDGVISYVAGKVNCSEHPIENEDNEYVDEVPYL